jgi:hypothetical protein
MDYSQQWIPTELILTLVTFFPLLGVLVILFLKEEPDSAPNRKF